MICFCNQNALQTQSKYTGSSKTISRYIIINYLTLQRLTTANDRQAGKKYNRESISDIEIAHVDWDMITPDVKFVI